MRNLYLIVILCALIFPVSVFSQGRPLEAPDDQVLRMEANRKTNAPFSILFKETTTYRSTDAQQLFVKYLGLRPGTDELRAGTVNTFGNVVLTRYQQYFKGIKVEHGSFTLAAKDSRASYMTGDFLFIDPSTSIIPSLTEDAARTKAWIFMDGTEPNDPVKTKGEIVFAESGFKKEPDGKARLAYKFFIDSRTKPMTHEDVFVDATTGEILFTDALIKAGCYKTDKIKTTATAPVDQPACTTSSPDVVAPLAASIYSGNLTTMVTRFTGGSYRLEALLGSELYPTHVKNIGHAAVSTYTLVSQFTAAMAAATEITDGDNSWTALEYNNANHDNTAFDVQWGAQRVYDYWKTRHTRNSWDNSDGILNCYVHADNNYDNAFWQGSGGINSMFYGDGSYAAGGFSSLTCLDVTGHEIGHGVCQATSNLTYSLESGAMNEGFSDIWGASVEHFADPHEVDAVAKSYFDIGEEITIGGGALRSMSNPKLYGQPDTYKGINWVADASDNGGVHTNSGVLNYWFYLVVSGKSGTNDLGNAYSVPAIGWTDAERIAFVGETSLSPSSGYSACRTAMINAATTLFGACSLQTEAVTRAWYAVGVGTDFAPCVPQISFSGVAQTVTEAGASGGATCLKTKTITVPVRISSAATQAATVSFTITGTAANGAALDYTISPATVVFPAGSAVNQNLTITINNDAYVEGDETIILNINTVTTAGNAVKANAYLQYTVTISDNDFAPTQSVALLNQTLFSEDFTVLPGWGQATNGGTNIWRQGNNAGSDAYFGGSNNCAYVSRNTSTFSYTNTAVSIARLQTPNINTTGATNVKLTFDYVSNGEMVTGVYYDYGTLWYSINGGTTWLPLPSATPYYQGVTTKTTTTVSLPSNANNITTLRIGFRWDNDNSAGTNPPFGIDNVIVRGDKTTSATVQSSVNSGSSSDQQYLGPNATVNFYDNVSGNVMGTIQNLSAHDYGCTTFEVDRSGTSALFITGDVSGNNKQRLSSKTFRVTPTTNNSSGTYRITLYYTAAEKTGYESASTRVWTPDNGSNNGVKITKSPGAISSMTNTSGNIKTAIESVGTFGSDHTITAQFTNGFSGFAVGIPPLSVLPLTLVDFTAVKSGAVVLLNWRVAQQINISKYIIQHSVDGSSFTDAGSLNANQQTDARYDFTHTQPVPGNNFYRIKIINADGGFSYSAIVKVNMSGTRSTLVVAPNPVTEDQFTIQYSHSSSIQQVSVIDAAGRILKTFKPVGTSGSIVVDATDIKPGIYMIKMLTADKEVMTQKLVRQ